MSNIKNINQNNLKIKKFTNLDINKKYEHVLYFLDNTNHSVMNSLLMNSFDKLFIVENFNKSIKLFSNNLINLKIFNNLIFNNNNIDNISKYYYKSYFNVNRIINRKEFNFSWNEKFWNTLLYQKLHNNILLSLAWRKYVSNFCDETVVPKIPFSNNFISPLKLYKIKKQLKKSMNKQLNLDTSLKVNLAEKDRQKKLSKFLLDYSFEDQVKYFRIKGLKKIYNYIVLVRYFFLEKFIKYLTKDGKKDKAIKICFNFLNNISKKNLKIYWDNYLNLNFINNLENFVQANNNNFTNLSNFSLLLLNRKQKLLISEKFKNLDIKKFKTIKNNNNFINFFEIYKTKNFLNINYNKNKYLLRPVLDSFFKTIYSISPSFRIIIKYIAGEKMYLPIPLHTHKKIFYGLKIFVDSAKLKKKDKSTLLKALTFEYDCLQSASTYGKATSYLKYYNINQTALKGRDQLKYL